MCDSLDFCLPLDPVTVAFEQPSYTVLEGASIVVNIVANRQFENGPFVVTVSSTDSTAQGMLAVLL